MFRFALVALAALTGAAPAAAITCDAPVVVTEFFSGGADAVLEAGDTYATGANNLANNVFEVWFSIQVSSQCDVKVIVDTCGSTQPEIALEVFPADQVICGADDLGNPPTEAIVAGECGNDEINGIETDFVHDDVGITEYLVRVVSINDEPFNEMKLNFQGSVSGSCLGDPHFRRWHHDVRDAFHGECDLVLAKKENLVDDKDLDVQVRTTIRDSYSFIEAVGVKMGDDVMEFHMDSMFVNGEKKEDDMFPLSFNGILITKNAEGRRQYRVYLPGHNALDIWATKHFMGVNLEGALKGSIGMLGDYSTGDMVARDGHIMDNFEDFGFEWQVAPSDPVIFMDAREPQLPYERCRMPAISAASRRRKLRGTNKELYDQAVEVCTKNHIPANVQSCIDDVVFTGEIDLAYDV